MNIVESGPSTSRDRKMDKLGFTYGSLTFVLLMVYFLIMRALGVAEVTELRIFNYLILAGGIFLSLRKYSRTGKEGSIEYFQGLKVGLYTTAVASALFALFTAIYLHIDTDLLTTLNEDVPFNYPVTPWSGAGAILIEGFAAGAILSFVMMQFFKK